MSGIHKNIPVGAESAHPPGYVQATDPGAVGAYKVWIDTSGGAGTWVYKVRNAANDDWETISGGGGGGGGSAFSMWDVNAPMTDPAVNTTLSRSFTASGDYADLAWVNQGTRSAAITNGQLVVTTPAADTAPGGLVVTPPTAPWCAMLPFEISGGVQVAMAGLMLYNSTGAKITRFKIYAIGGAWVIGVANGSVGGGYSDVLTSQPSPGGSRGCLAIGSDGTNLKFWVASESGRLWSEAPYYSTTVATHLGAITGVGLFTAAVSGAALKAGFSRLVFVSQATPIPLGALRTITGS